MAHRTFHDLCQLPIPMGTGWLLAACTEAKGKQDFLTRQKPEVLNALRERAMVQSAESSNRMEGVTVAEERLRPLVLAHAKPRDRSEEEIAGYRKAMEWIFTRKRKVAIEPRIILHLHAFAQGGASADAGKWKQKDNEIIEILRSGDRRIRFKPTSAKETPKAIRKLCADYAAACNEQRVPALLLVATFVFDFLCIHPFRDGNGRVSRLATTQLLLEHGFDVVRYLSLERLIEQTKADYYAVLERCSTNWHFGKNEIVPWWNYFLGIVHRAHQEVATQIEITTGRSAKGDLVRQAVSKKVGPFTLAELRTQFPGVSAQLIKKVLADMKRTGEVAVMGRGRGATWQRKAK